MAKKKELKDELIRRMEEQLARKARQDLLYFTLMTMPNFRPADFHRRYYEVLTRFARGEIRKLAIFMPPQHGKSEGSTRRLPAFMLGLDPDLKLAIVSYNAPKARKFNREIQRVIDTPEYRRIFPETTLNGSNITTVASSWLRNADECEIVGRRGGFKTVGVGGPLTGEPVDILIMDDIYKDAKTAWSPTVRESVADWYDTVAETRLHNASRQLMVFTRWHEEDLAGTLITQQGLYDSEENPDGWVVIVYPAIKEGAPTRFDPRQEGEALWPERHSLEKLLRTRQRNPQVFESLYQQNPRPMEGLMYREFRTYDTIPLAPAAKCRRANYTDTADTGADFFCSIFYEERPTGNYVTDVIYTKKPMEYTEQEMARVATLRGTEICFVESNNGGRGFMRNVERICREMGNTRTSFSGFSQHLNKQVRIFAASNEVCNLVFFPVGWEKRWPDFARALKGYRKEGSNAHDDAPDTLTGTVEKRGVGLGVGLTDAEILAMGL